MSRRVAVWLFLGILFVALVAIAAATAKDVKTDDAVHADGIEYSTVQVNEPDGDDVETVALVQVVGGIVNGRGSTSDGEVGSDTVVPLLEELAVDDGIKGVILEVDTPGGAVLASDEIAEAVRALQERKKPVVSWMRDTAASGGYYISAPADTIVAHPTTTTGSIGVIFYSTNIEGLSKKVGLKPVVIKSGKLKDLGSPFRDMTRQERSILQTMIDEMYGRFVDVVVKGRGMSEKRVRELADGRIYTGSQAKEFGLVDELGGRDTAFSEMAKLLDADDVSVVRYEPDVSFEDFLSLFGSAASDRQQVAKVLGGDMRRFGNARFEYRSIL